MVKKKKLTLEEINIKLIEGLDSSPIELEEIFESLSKESKFSKTLLKKQFEEIKRIDINKNKQIEEEKRMTAEEEIKEKESITSKENEEPINNKGSNFIRHGKFGSYVDVDAVVDTIRYHNHFITIYGKQSEEIWVYEEGIYKLNGRATILTQAEELLESWAKTKVVNEILNKIKRQTELSREEFDNIPKELLPLKNGILNFKTGEFFDYSPNYYFKTKIEVDYNPNANSSCWLNFIEDTFYPDDSPVVQEWFGFCLYRDYFIKKGFIGVGVGDTGKTVFQNVLLKFFGTKNTSGLNLQKIVKDNNFSKSSLYNKYINLYDDMSASDINEGGGFKMVTGRSPITAEYKFGDEFQFINFAKMTFCCNKIPPIKDTDDLTYYNRWLPIPFDNVVPESEQDKFLFEKLTTPGELSGILNWALIGLNRILANGRFSCNKTPEEIKGIMDRSSHPLAEFVHDCLEEEEKSKITKEEMFQIYTEWAKQKNKTRLTVDRLGKQLPRYCKFILDARDGKVRSWNNVKIKENNDSLHIFLKNIRGQGLLLQGLDIISKKVCNLSQEKEEINLEDFSEKEEEFSEEQIRENEKILEDFE
jgi:P4 family phage/plasmid primase-like protien